MTGVTVVLVHGFTGSPSDLEPLAVRLEPALGEGRVRLVTLPGHGGEKAGLTFDRDIMVGHVSDILRGLKKNNRLVALVGHSTGGNIVLDALEATGLVPELVVLAATPHAIDLSYLGRWQQHRHGREEVSLSSVATMVKLINSTGANGSARPFPALILQGDADDLVPPEEALRWAGKFDGAARLVMVPGGAHQLFTGPSAALAIDEVVRVVTGLEDGMHEPADFVLRHMEEVEPEVRRFLEKSPESARHLANCPSGRRVAGEEPRLPAAVDWSPVFANIEITTRCNLACRFCARTVGKRHEKDISVETFAGILDRLPHAYRITLVGLGEPLLHPRVVELVTHASAEGRRTALVTNGMLLSENLGAALLAAGLDSIAFSIDAASMELAGQLRRGSDIGRIVANIRAFTRLARQANRPISTAVFSAVSQDSVRSLPELVDLVSGLGVHVLMLTDLNYPINQPASLSSNVTPDITGMIRKAVKSSISRNLPVLTVRGLEEFGQAVRWRESMLLPPDHLYRRSEKRQFCCSPWQTAAVDVDGTVTLCDCLPERPLGNLFKTPLEEMWNGKEMRAHRDRMLGNDPPAACRECPRF